MLTSRGQVSAKEQLRGIMRKCKPFPVCDNATRASATKNSTLDTRVRELTKLTIYITNVSRRHEI